MSTDGVADVVVRARDLVPTLEANRAFAEEHARLAPEVVNACSEAGMFGLAAPLDVGGVEATLADIYEAHEIVASADPSAAWYMVNSMPLARLAAFIEPRFWPDLYKTPLKNNGYSAVAGGRLTPAEGRDGYLLSGAWPLMTGVRDADWAMVLAVLREPDQPPAALQTVIPTAQLEVTEIWHDAIGMRGTGSHQVATTDCFVPTGLAVGPLAPPKIDRPLYRCAPFILPGAFNSAVPIGILRAALQSAALAVKDKVSSIFGQSAASSSALLELFADALLSAELLSRGIKSALDDVWRYAERDETPPAPLRAVVAGSPFHAAKIAREAISEIYSRSSSAAFFAGHPLERAMRDIHAVGYGVDTLRQLHHDTGRVAIGLAPLTPGF